MRRQRDIDLVFVVKLCLSGVVHLDEIGRLGADGADHADHNSRPSMIHHHGLTGDQRLLALDHPGRLRTRLDASTARRADPLAADRLSGLGIGLLLQRAVPDDALSAGAALGLLDNVDKLVGDQLSPRSALRIVRSRREVQIGSTGERTGAVLFCRTVHVHFYTSEVGAERMLQLAAQRRRQRRATRSIRGPRGRLRRARRDLLHESTLANRRIRLSRIGSLPC